MASVLQSKDIDSMNGSRKQSICSLHETHPSFKNRHCPRGNNGQNSKQMRPGNKLQINGTRK